MNNYSDLRKPNTSAPAAMPINDIPSVITPTREQKRSAPLPKSDSEKAAWDQCDQTYTKLCTRHETYAENAERLDTSMIVTGVHSDLRDVAAVKGSPVHLYDSLLAIGKTMDAVPAYGEEVSRLSPNLAEATQKVKAEEAAHKAAHMEKLAAKKTGSLMSPK